MRKEVRNCSSGAPFTEALDRRVDKVLNPSSVKGEDLKGK